MLNSKKRLCFDLDIPGAYSFAPYGTEQSCFQFALELKVCKIPVALNFGRVEKGLRRTAGMALPN